jgi:hypothetical protein
VCARGFVAILELLRTFALAKRVDVVDDLGHATTYTQGEGPS